MESPTNARLKANKSSQWSANLDPDLKACGYNFLDVTESTESSVPDQGTLSTSGRSLHFDLSGVKEKLSQNDISEVQYGVGTKTYELSINSQRGFKRDSRQMTQRSKVVYSTLTLANGIQVKIDLSETLITEKLYVDDTLSIPVGSGENPV